MDRREFLTRTSALVVAASVPAAASRSEPEWRDWTKDRLYRMSGIGQHVVVNDSGTYRAYGAGDDISAAIYNISPANVPLLKAKG